MKNELKFRGFTLIEVLVVIAIIGVLASILLPILARSKTKAARIKCVSNLSQIGKAFTSFSSNHEGQLPWQLTDSHLKEQFGDRYVQKLGTIFSAPALKLEIVQAAILHSPCDGERVAIMEELQSKWSDIDVKQGTTIPDEAISYLLVEGADIGRPTTVLATVRNLYPCDMKAARWVGADEDHSHSVTMLNKGEGQLVMADGSAALSDDSDVGRNGVLTKAHVESSGGVTEGPASTRLIGCFGSGCVVDKEQIGEEQVQEEGVHGLLATYYTGKNWDGESAQRVDETLFLPFGQAHPLRQGEQPDCPVMDYDIPLIGASPSSAHPLETAKWQGQLKAEFSEEYTFYMRVDNEGWLFIDGREVLHRADRPISGWRPVSSNPVSLKAGEWVDIEVRHKEWHSYRRPQFSFILIEWESPSTKRGKIHCRNLRPPPLGIGK